MAAAAAFDSMALLAPYLNPFILADKGGMMMVGSGDAAAVSLGPQEGGVASRILHGSAAAAHIPEAASPTLAHVYCISDVEEMSARAPGSAKGIQERLTRGVGGVYIKLDTPGADFNEPEPPRVGDDLPDEVPEEDERADDSLDATGEETTMVTAIASAATAAAAAGAAARAAGKPPKAGDPDPEVEAYAQYYPRLASSRGF
ncbi:unnamed protein product, partial [Phaeothamnion confervicola]